MSSRYLLVTRRHEEDIFFFSEDIQKISLRHLMNIFLISYRKIFLMSSGFQKMVDILRHAEDIF